MSSRCVCGLLIVCVLLLVLAACVPVISLQPWYTDKDVIFNPWLEGSWAPLDEQGKTQPDTTVNIERDGGNGYTFSYLEKEAPNVKITYSLHLFRVGEQAFLDSVGSDAFYKDHRLDDQMKLAVHMPGKITIEKDSVHIQMLDDEWLDKKLQETPALVRHENADRQTLLTAPTTELQQFLVKAAADEKAFAVKIELRRK